MTTDYIAEHDGPTLAERQWWDTYQTGVSDMQHVMSEIVTVTTKTYRWTGTGFTEGEGPFDLSARYLPNDNSAGAHNGLSQGRVADANGTVEFFAPLSMFVPANAHRPGVLRVWMRPAGTPEPTPPLLLTDGTPAVTEEVIA